MKDYVDLTYSLGRLPLTTYPDKLTRYLFKRFDLNPGITFWMSAVAVGNSFVALLNVASLAMASTSRGLRKATVPMQRWQSPTSRMRAFLMKTTSSMSCIQSRSSSTSTIRKEWSRRS